jgi:hypothetical protein
MAPAHDTVTVTEEQRARRVPTSATPMLATIGLVRMFRDVVKRADQRQEARALEAMASKSPSVPEPGRLRTSATQPALRVRGAWGR